MPGRLFCYCSSSPVFALCHEAGVTWATLLTTSLAWLSTPRGDRRATTWPSRSTPSSGFCSELLRGRDCHQLAASDSHGAWFPPPGLACSPWGPPALSPPSTLEASGASRARPLPQPQITATSRRRASLRAPKRLVCCCPTSWVVQSSLALSIKPTPHPTYKRPRHTQF